MSLTNPIPRGVRTSPVYACNGVTVNFPVPFWFLDGLDLLVLVTTPPSTVAAILTYVADFSVTGTGLPGGGSITCLIAPANGATLQILGLRVPSRVTSIANGGALDAAALDIELDTIEITLQELRRDVDRANAAIAGAGDTSWAALPITRGQGLLALRNNTTAGLNWLTVVQAALTGNEADPANIRFSDAFWPVGGAAWAFVLAALAAGLPGGFTPGQLAALQAQAVAYKAIP